MKKKPIHNKIGLILLIAQIVGWLVYSMTYLDDMNWTRDECVCGGELTYEHIIGNGERLYECEDCGRNFRLVNKYER